VDCFSAFSDKLLAFREHFSAIPDYFFSFRDNVSAFRDYFLTFRDHFSGFRDYFFPFRSHFLAFRRAGWVFRASRPPFLADGHRACCPRYSDGSIRPGSLFARGAQAGNGSFVTASNHASRPVALQQTVAASWQSAAFSAVDGQMAAFCRDAAAAKAVPDLAAVDPLEGPRARHKFRAASTQTRPSATRSHAMGERTPARSHFREDQRCNVDLAAAENGTLLHQWLWRSEERRGREVAPGAKPCSRPGGSVASSSAFL
jgi:hypothetical protein